MAESNAIDPAEAPPPVEDKELTPEEVSAATEQTEKCRIITKDAFTLGLRRMLNLSIDGYPRAIRTVRAIRNEYLRKHSGVQTAAIEAAAADYQKAKKNPPTAQDETQNAQDVAVADVDDAYQKFEMKAAMLALVPYVGLPSSVILYAWTTLRRCCLMAAIYGHDMSSEETRAKILYAYAGIRVTSQGAYMLGKATGIVWAAIAGPAVKAIPLPMAVAAIASVEASEITDARNHDIFKESRVEVPKEEYELILDPEPTSDDYAALMKEGTLYMMLLARSRATRAWDIVTDKERKEANAWLAKATGEGKAEEVKKFFESIDTNRDGTIQEEEFIAVFSKKGFSTDECKKLLAEIDRDADGKVSYDEFTSWVMKGSDSNIAAKNGIHYKESAIALGAKAASKLESGYAMAKEASAKAAAAASGYAQAAADYYQGTKKTETQT